MTTILCYFFSFLAEAVILWQYTSALFIPRHSAKIRLALLCVFYLVLFAVSLFELKWLNASLYLLTGFLFLFAGYRIKWHLAFFHSAVLTAVMAMCELTVYSIIGHFAPHFLRKTQIRTTLSLLPFSAK